MNLPTREECEGWDQGQVAAFMNQMKMHECGVTVKRYQINGHRLLNMTENDLRKFSLVLQPQLQKIVQDIKKNDGNIGLLDKLRRLKNKQVPRVPARDYREEREESEGSDPEYDNDTYEAPCVDHDDSYEPPPTHNQRVFSSGPVPRGEYLDSCRGRPERPPKKSQLPAIPGKQLPPRPRANHHQDDEEDYIDPEGNNDDDNYIEPNENPPHRGRAVRELPKVPPQHQDCHADKEVKPQVPPNLNRLCPMPTPQSHPLLPKPSPRLPRRTVDEPTGDEEYEVCDTNDKDKPSDSRPPLRPKPLPRERSPKPPVKPNLPAKPSQRDFENRTLPVIPSEPVSTPPKSLSMDLKRPKHPVPQFMSHRQPDRGQGDDSENDSSDQDKESEMHTKPWYASSCDRKTADDALCHSNQDGAFLVRKSSGHDAQQPYTLVVFYKGRVYNIPIRYLPSTQQYALGREKKGEEYFSSVANIIKHHQRAPLVLIDSQSNTKDTTRLSLPVRP